MRLTRQSEIAIGILVQCAAAAVGTRLRTADLAENCGTTRVHAAQVTALLARNGLLEGEPGRSGGVRLAKVATGITLSDILRITQPDLVVTIDHASRQRRSDLTILDTIIDASRTQAVRLFEQFTLQDMLTQTTQNTLPCIDCAMFAAVPSTSSFKQRCQNPTGFIIAELDAFNKRRFPKSEIS